MPDLKSSKFLSDENFSVKIIKKLNKFGFDIKIPAKGLRNGFLYASAVEEGRIILTHDTDFMDSKRFPASKTKGIILIRIHPPEKEIVMNALLKFFQTASEAEVSGKLVCLKADGSIAP